MAKKIRKSLTRTARQTKRGGRLSSSATTIVISDSSDEDVEMNATVIPLQAAPSSGNPLTPPPDANKSTDQGTRPLFYESRLPNDGKDVKPMYEEVSTGALLSLDGMINTSHNASFPSHNDSIIDRPASTPLECKVPNPFEYSLISDTSLQMSGVAEENTLQGEDFLTLDETVVAVAAGGGGGPRPGEGESTTKGLPKEEMMNQTLEDGEIIDVETAAESCHDDSVVFVSEGILTPLGKQKMVSRLGQAEKALHLIEIIHSFFQSKKMSMALLLKEKAEMYRQEAMHRKKAQQVQGPPGRKRRMIIIDGSNVAFRYVSAYLTAILL